MLIRKHVCLNFQVGQLAGERLDVPDDELSIPSDSRDGVDIVFATIVNTKLGYLELFLLEKCSPFKIVVHINDVVICEEDSYNTWFWWVVLSLVSSSLVPSLSLFWKNFLAPMVAVASCFLSSSSLEPRVREPLVSRLKVMGTQL